MELTQDEKDELSINLLREWWIAATQAFVNVAGSSKALEQLAPGFQHHGRSGYHILVKFMGLKEEVSSIAAFECIVKTIISGCPARVGLFEDGIIWTIDGCRTAGQSKEACLSHCYYAGIGMVEESVPELEYILHESLSQGDAHCQASIGKCGKSLPVGKLIREYYPQMLELNTQQWSFWSCASIGECWAIVMRAIEEVLGRHTAMTLLEPYMKRSGISLGRRMNWAEEGWKPPGNIIKAITIVQDCFGMEGNVGVNETNSGEICACPFSGGPVGICTQFEAFLNGVCQSIDPSYEFIYDRMMGKGDETCHWTIREKNHDLRIDVSHSSDEGEMLKKLKWRLTNGEITLEEYRQLKNEILDM